MLRLRLEAPLSGPIPPPGVVEAAAQFKEISKSF
jgi:hypothetical protein